ncbi:MAG: hypothetical protein KAS72_07975 [Phycisphaerales bacterium]|nr:hypothetical protein [Phycisphaerales bacterium]
MMWKRVQTGGLVAIITLFIWLIAESQSLDSKSQLIQLNLRVPAGSNLIITSDHPETASVKLDLQGSTAALDDLLHRITTPIDVTLDTRSIHRVDLRETLAEIPPFKDSGVNLRDVDPQVIERVVVERLVQLENIPVYLPDLPGIDHDPPTIAPATITASLPESLAGRLGATPTAVVNISSIADEFAAGRQIDRQLPVRLEGLADNPLVTLTPATVQLSVAVKDSISRWTSTLSVWVQMPADLTAQYGVEIAKEDKSIEVVFSGPSDVINTLSQAVDLSNVAPFIALTSDDLFNGVQTAQLRFRELPEGVTAIPAKEQVSLTITPTPGR